MSEDISRHIAEQLLRIGAVSLSPAVPFKWASGLWSPVYCDNRLAMAYPGFREELVDGFVKITQDFDLDCTVVAGTATAGIPHAAWLASRLHLPMIYVRTRAKDHGKGKQIEGCLQSGERVIVIEDLVSTGMSSTAVVAPIRAANASVLAVLAIFTYGFDRAIRAFREADVALHTLTSFPVLIDVAADTGFVSGNDLASLESWYRDPEGWSKAFDEIRSASVANSSKENTLNG